MSRLLGLFINSKLSFVKSMPTRVLKSSALLAAFWLFE